jgi:hypothetical protein
MVTLLVQPTAAELAEVATVFDQYRRHYGQPVVAGQTLAWLTCVWTASWQTRFGHGDCWPLP